MKWIETFGSRRLPALAAVALMLFAGRSGPVAGAELPLNEIISRVEARYDVAGFTANFHQISTIKAMDISDEARGKMYVKRPGKMRWEYESPEVQIIITNGNRLWVYRPDDNQVMVGKAPQFFADGKGAGFLADIRLLRRKFEITAADSPDERFYALKLRPMETIEVSEIHLYVSRDSFTVQRVITYNPYGDETRIDLIDSRFDRIPDDSLFTFTIPDGVDVLEMDE
jgi:outer membrane lipoprotein carrier protein